ncbi:hypothetical protein [Roseovarius spongiae]|uniref:hypothetical protein n=1 Tax=Roseovarius spongiae TaxID=2320272 RepID=UPI0014094A22|nr:hypothetical protein [Roseovarius spongiae]
MTETQLPSRIIRQTEIQPLVAQGLIQDYPVAVRSPREVVGGGFADPTRNPNTWTVYFKIGGEWAQVFSARGLRREWSSLDRLETWLRSMSFRFFWVRNDLDPVEDPGDGPLGGPNLK